MFLNSVQPYILGIIAAAVVVQYGLALFCLMKLAYLDIPKKQYVLWNILILAVFYIGSAVFLVYYFKVKKDKIIEPEQSASQSAAPDPAVQTDTDTAGQAAQDGAEGTRSPQTPEADGAAQDENNDQNDIKSGGNL